MIEFKKFWWMIKKELISLKRHPTRLVSILVFPIIMILLFGYGMGGEMTDLPVVVVSQSQGDLTDLTLNSIKNTDKAVAANDKEKAEKYLKLAIKSLDNAKVKGLVHKNKVDRVKSRLTKKVNNMETK